MSAPRATRLCAVLGAALLTPLALAAGVGDLLSGISSQDQTTALRTALTQGAQAAVSKLGTTDGFLGNAKVRIPLPGKLAKAEKTLKRIGLGSQTDALVTTMNRAAEAAVPEARVLLVDAVKQMSVQDAAGILTGGQDSATKYFRGKTEAALTAKFLPIVKQRTQQLDLASRYNAVASQAASFGLVDAKESSVESYVTQKALDGLFTMMAEEEAAIRTNPVGQASKLLQKVFGAVRQTP